jgi:transmembrane sensor
MFRFLQTMHKRLGRQHKAQTGTGEIEGLLSSDMRRLHAIDPETDLRWQWLRVAMEAGHRTEMPRPSGGKIRWARPALSFAVAAILLIVVGLVWLDRTSTMTYETAKRQQAAITLFDSTEVTLNHTSELTVERRPFDKVRRVALKGEAFFRVRRNGAPFTVLTDVATIQVLGTEFNVRVRDDLLEVAVISGNVHVSVRKDGTDSMVVLAKGQMAACRKGGGPGMPGPLLFFSDYPGWIHGKFLFNRTSLVSVCKEIEDQFDVVVRIGNTRLSNETITGALDARTAETALAALSGLTGNKYRYENGVYSLY